MASAVVREDEDYVHSVNKWLSAAYSGTEYREDQAKYLFSDDRPSALYSDFLDESESDDDYDEHSQEEMDDFEDVEEEEDLILVQSAPSPKIDINDMNLYVCIGNWKVKELMEMLDNVKMDMNFDKSNPYIQMVEIVGPRYDPAEVRKKIISKMLELGADVNGVRSHTGQSLIMWSLMLHSRSVLGLLLNEPWKHKIDLEAVDKNKQETALFYAIRWRLVPYRGVGGPMPLWFTKTLIEMGSSLKHRNVDDYEPLDVAVERNDTECAALLLEMGASIRTAPYPVSLYPPLVRCARFNMIDMAKVLLQAGFTTDANKYKGETPIYMALMHDNPEMINLFIRSGSNFSLEPYLFEHRVDHDFKVPDNIQMETNVVWKKLCSLAETPLSLQKQARKSLWKIFGERRISVSKIYDIDIPRCLADFVYSI